MRWKNRIPRDGMRRIVRRFLLWPTLLENQWRWLEWALIEQESWLGNNNLWQRWTDRRWADEAKEKI